MGHGVRNSNAGDTHNSLDSVLVNSKRQLNIDGVSVTDGRVVNVQYARRVKEHNGRGLGYRNRNEEHAHLLYKRYGDDTLPTSYCILYVQKDKVL